MKKQNKKARECNRCGQVISKTQTHEQYCETLSDHQLLSNAVFYLQQIYELVWKIKNKSED